MVQRARLGGHTPAGVGCWRLKQLTYCSGFMRQATPMRQRRSGRCGNGQQYRQHLRAPPRCSSADARLRRPTAYNPILQ